METLRSAKPSCAGSIPAGASEKVCLFPTTHSCEKYGKIVMSIAEMVKLVDTGDLKSPAFNRRAGSIPALGTHSYEI